MEKQINILNRKISYGTMVILSKDSGSNGMVLFNQNLSILLELSTKKIITNIHMGQVIDLVHKFQKLSEQSENTKFEKYVISELMKELTTFLSLLKSPPEEG